MDCHRNCREINCAIMAQDFSPVARRKIAGMLDVLQDLTTTLQVKKTSQNAQVILRQFHRDGAAPAVSVLLSAHNCLHTLPEAVESILRQTFTDWELILCDDGSTDGTLQVAEAYAAAYPERIVLLRNPENLGLAASLNRCLAAARGRYIARMDGDDRCSPDRLAAEVQALDRDPALAVVSTDMGCFDEAGVWGTISHPAAPRPIDFLSGVPFCHAACMIRREALTAVSGYSEDRRYQRVEDYHLWVRLYAAGFRGRNLHRTLYWVREDRAAYERRRFRYRVNEVRVRWKAVRCLGLPVAGYLSGLRPLLVGLLPPGLYRYLHRRKLQKFQGGNAEA